MDGAFINSSDRIKTRNRNRSNDSKRHEQMVMHRKIKRLHTDAEPCNYRIVQCKPELQEKEFQTQIKWCAL